MNSQVLFYQLSIRQFGAMPRLHLTPGVSVRDSLITVLEATPKLLDGVELNCQEVAQVLPYIPIM